MNYELEVHVHWEVRYLDNLHCDYSPNWEGTDTALPLNTTATVLSAKASARQKGPFYIRFSGRGFVSLGYDRELQAMKYCVM